MSLSIAHRYLKHALLLMGLAIPFAGCHQLEELETDESLDKEISRHSDGARLNTAEYRLDRLPTSGQVHTLPWTGSDWPIETDSINERWQPGAHSPAEKYDDAIHGWRPAPLADFVPSEEGYCAQEGQNYYAELGPLATTIHQNLGTGFFMDGLDSDGDGHIDECDDLDGLSAHWNLSHARVAVGILEEKPEDSVQLNDVRFEPRDLSALLMAAYETLTVVGVNTGCEGSLMTITPFSHSQPEHCAFLDAKDFHVTLVQNIGALGMPMGETRRASDEKRYATVVGYSVVQMDTIDGRHAMDMVQGIQAVPEHQYYAVTTDVTYLNGQGSTSESAYEVRSYGYVLVTDEHSRILSGHWAGDAEHDAPPHLFWQPQKAESASVEGLDLVRIRQLIGSTGTEL